MGPTEQWISNSLSHATGLRSAKVVIAHPGVEAGIQMAAAMVSQSAIEFLFPKS
jgi:hypothetical protein